ncbi:PREDICTED: uncharacterized protein LOC107338616 isoform X3 [Acropora digitifera]|uniref:uncharacterized protein LOC107338616 isoform X3 n=1 Tax=Acropora digitifera TaxID=70779 RepID=UPI00077A5D9D|nr:PREDICTED: uncharacterized protein LOC107338616 isoform X3 [Acropora digitifera]
MTICPKHRRELTIDWAGRKSSTCSYPSHRGPRKQMKNVRRINISISEEVFARYQISVPIGSAICASCRATHYKAKNVLYQDAASDKHQETIPEEMPSVSGAQLDTVHCEVSSTMIGETQSLSSQSSQGTGNILSGPEGEADTLSSQSSQSTLPEKEISIWLDEKEEQHVKRQTLNETVSTLTDGRVSPLLSTLNTEWDDISSTQQKYYTRKAREIFAATLSVVSPGQEEALWESLRREPILENEGTSAKKRKYFDVKSDLIDGLIEAHNQAQSWQTKRQILSLFVNDFSRLELQKMIPGLSKWRIDQARNHATETGKGQPILEKPIYRARIETAKVDHFLDYISRPELLQDVAFGTKTLKLDSGERVIIPAVVRTLIPSRIIQQYICYCKQEQFQPASETSLYRILDVCSASMQKSLQGLDNVTAEGTEAIDNLTKMIETLVENGAEEGWGKTTECKVKEVKRETMCEFFGKRGLSWHISAVVTKKDSRIEVECFVHVFNFCTQNNYAVASIFEHLFQTIKAEYQSISKAFVRSDNAGCYHNGPLILCLHEVAKNAGVNLIRYDFSEPQAGKDICDRKTAPMKAHIRRFVNENNDVTTAEEMKKALESHGGLRGCRVAVVEIDPSKDLHEANKIPDISLLYNFKFEDGGIRVWKAYNIGEGKLLNYKNLQIQPQEIASLFVKQPFGPRQKECGVIGERVAAQSEIFSCSESTCVLTFKSEREAQAHMDSGKHVKELESVSLYDTIRLRWAERVTGISSVAQEASAVFAHEESASSKTKASSMGWALKATQKRPRLGEKVKAFLIEKFEAGERSGTKADPLSVSREMKFKRDDKGELVFQPEEWKTAKTIKSFFSRYSAKLKQQGVSTPKDMGGSQPEVDEEMAHDIEALEFETAMQNLRQAVYNDLKIPEHPIEVDQFNICKLMQEGKLKALKLLDLKAICATIGLPAEGSQARKKSFVEPLKELVKKCTCKGSSDVY